MAKTYNIDIRPIKTIFGNYKSEVSSQLQRFQRWTLTPASLHRTVRDEINFPDHHSLMKFVVGRIGYYS
jgi:hypothetical protein